MMMISGGMNNEDAEGKNEVLWFTYINTHRSWEIARDLNHSSTRKPALLFHCFNSSNYAIEGESSRFNENNVVVCTGECEELNIEVKRWYDTVIYIINSVT